MSSAVAAAGVFVLAVVAPFEMSAPLLRLPGQSLSNLEAALLAVCIAWTAANWRSAPWRLHRVPLLGAWTAFVLMMIVAAVAAPHRANALHMAGRLGAAAVVYVVAVEGLNTPRRVRIAMALCVGSGVAVALLAILEYLQIAAVLNLLRLFRPSVTAVGAQVRAGGSLQYPTIASMYLEVVFAFGIGLLLAATDARAGVETMVWCGALVIIGEAITLTFTRAGLITMGMSLGCAALWRWRERGVDRGVRTIVAVSAAIAVLFIASRPAQSLWLRMTSEGQDAWYRARIESPLQLSFGTDKAQYVPLRTTNAGRLVWDSADVPPTLLSYHWLDAGGDRVVAWEGERTPFPHPIEPGSTVALTALVRAPREPGRYQLEWDVVQEGRLWFSTEQGAPDPMTSAATVTGFGTGVPLPTTPRPLRAVRPGRMALWRTAARMVLAHPLLGVGPDNFRLLYGSYAGLAGADQRTHSNNMYLEVLVGGGLLAFAAFARFAVRAGALFGAAPRYRFGVGIAAAGLAIAVHGVVDSFLSFAPTYVLFALTLGFAAAVVRGGEISADAHRV